MIFGTGIDIIEIARIKKVVESPRFRQRVYTTAELEYCRSRGANEIASLAARFAGKEAVAKAFGTGMYGGTFSDIEILPDELGAPRVRLSNGFAELVAAKKITKVHVSLSHAQTFATAVCVLEVTE